ncbi:hypothetical protein SteCoe_4278 [Stentor coeruleus]|uniref:EF-hand domain-containing protein n=1 Tax=Stentor coeruleus TaxID=5963 RepID=A0A1R2CUZ0_9CILI|nr:hypothetical protein SteCoe_4278 [Stentor coeruleus]
MGNFVNISYLQNPINTHLLFLTNWSPQDIGKLFKNFSSMQEVTGFYILRSQLKLISRETPLAGNEDTLIKYFNVTSTKKINLMEVLSSLITYSIASWKIKVKLAYLVFDFDESKTITKDEMVIMIISFIRGISQSTNSTLYESLDLEPLGRQCFELANSDPEGRITLDQLTNWVGECEDIVQLFQKYELKTEPSTKPRILARRKISIGLKKDNLIKRESISIPFAGRSKLKHMKNFSLPRVIEKNDWKTRDKDLQFLHDIFYKHANDRGYSPVGELYQELIESIHFKKESEFFFHEFDFNANTLISFSQLIEFFDKCKSKQGYFIKKGQEVFYPANEPFVQKGFFSVKMQTLRSMFMNFDKNKDGFLTYNELKDGLKKHFTKATIKEIFENYDIDGNKLIDFTEFMNVFSPLRKCFQCNRRKFSVSQA